MGFVPFSRGISPKGNVMAQLEFELSFYEATVQHFNHYAACTLPYGIKYSYLIQIIYTQLYDFKFLFIFTNIHLFAHNYVVSSIPIYH